MARPGPSRSKRGSTPLHAPVYGSSCVTLIVDPGATQDDTFPTAAPPHGWQIGAIVSFAARPAIIGHRGAAGLEPENTLASFTRAFELGVDAVELDVHVCEDALVVIHDPTLERTTSGTGKVANTSLVTLRGLDAGNGQRVPLLEEVLALLPAGVGLNVELKGAGSATPLARFLAGNPVDELLVSSFDHSMLREFCEQAPAVRVAPLLSHLRRDAREPADRSRSRFANLGLRIATAPRVAALRERGLDVLVYTVNEDAEAQSLFAMGVAGIFTDYPDRIHARCSS